MGNITAPAYVQPVIHLQPATSAEDGVRALLDAALGDVEGRHVLVKPDWNARTEPRPGENTTPGFLGEVLAWLTDHGAASIALAHSSLLTPPDVPYTSFTDLLEIAGCTGLLEDHPHTRLVDLEIEPMVRRDGFLVPQAVLDADLRIDCVRLKTHMGTQIAVGCKGLMGLLPDSEHLRMHRDGLDMLLARLANTLPPDWTLVEADVGMEGDGPHHGAAVPTGYHLAGDDLLELDASAAQLMGIDDVAHVAALARLQGREVPALAPDLVPHARTFRPPTGVIEATRAARVFPGDSCATCHAAASALLDYAKENPGQVRTVAGLAKAMLVSGLELYMGHQPPERAPGKGTCVALGDCARSFAASHGIPHVGGCPVRVETTTPALAEAIARGEA